MYRQGDLLLKQINKLPKGLKISNTLVLVHSDTTQHNHQLKSGQVFQDDKDLMFLKLLKDTDLIHEEHKTINLPKGFYEVIRQRQYLDKDMIALVQD